MKFRKSIIILSVVLVCVLICWFASVSILPGLGHFLIKNGLPYQADAVVVLFTGVDYYPRLIEAASIYSKGIAGYIVIDGNRKNAALRDLESLGFVTCCPWYEDSVQILEILGVPRNKVITVSAEDAFDTISEALAIGPHLIEKKMTRIIVTTSKFHTRRASHIWKKLYGDIMQIYSAAAQKDEFDPEKWWQDGQQIRWVLSEYGAWVYYFWQTAFDHHNADDA